MDPKLPVTADLHRLTESAMVIGPLLRKPKCSKAKKKEDIQKEKKIQEAAGKQLLLLGLFLDRMRIRKEDYMENLPYLYGQLLKAADELHELYCDVVRDGQKPQELVGSSMFRQRIGVAAPHAAGAEPEDHAILCVGESLPPEE